MSARNRSHLINLIGNPSNPVDYGNPFGPAFTCAQHEYSCRPISNRQPTPLLRPDHIDSRAVLCEEAPLTLERCLTECNWCHNVLASLPVRIESPARVYHNYKASHASCLILPQ